MVKMSIAQLTLRKNRHVHRYCIYYMYLCTPNLLRKITEVLIDDLLRNTRNYWSNLSVNFVC